MKCWKSLSVVLFFLLSVCAAGEAQTPTFHANVNLIDVTFSARTPQGVAVSDLNQSEVHVFEDDVPQTVQFFDHSSLPLTVGLIIDASGSQKTFFRKHRHDLEKFLKDALAPQDQAFLICFGNYVRLVSDLTPSVDNIMKNYERYEHGDYNFPELGPVENRSEGTALFDSIYYAATGKLQTSTQGRRALIVFSDGEDNSSSHDVMDAIEAAQNADILVYCIRYTERKKTLTSRDKYGMRVMARIAQDTGAGDYDAVNGEHLGETFRQIGAELRTLYTVGYYSGNRRHDGTFRRVRISVTRPDVIVRAKAGYYAKP